MPKQKEPEKAEDMGNDRCATGSGSEVESEFHYHHYHKEIEKVREPAKEPEVLTVTTPAGETVLLGRPPYVPLTQAHGFALEVETRDHFVETVAALEPEADAEAIVVSFDDGTATAVLDRRRGGHRKVVWKAQRDPLSGWLCLAADLTFSQRALLLALTAEGHVLQIEKNQLTALKKDVEVWQGTRNIDLKAVEPDPLAAKKSDEHTITATIKESTLTTPLPKRWPVKAPVFRDGLAVEAELWMPRHPLQEQADKSVRFAVTLQRLSPSAEDIMHEALEHELAELRRAFEKAGLTKDGRLVVVRGTQETKPYAPVGSVTGEAYR